MRTRHHGWLGICRFSLFLGATVVWADSNLTSLVDLFIGTASGANGGSGGNVFPGVLFLVRPCYETADNHT